MAHLISDARQSSDRLTLDQFCPSRIQASSIPEPSRAISDDPAHQGPLKTDVTANFLALNPLMPQDLFAFV